MLLKLLLIGLLLVVVLGGGRRVFGLVQGLKRAPSQFKEGKARAEDPVPFAKEVNGRVRQRQHDDV